MLRTETDSLIYAMAWALARQNGGIDVVRTAFHIPEEIDL